jgi:membrane-associated phospholipid phosphatase
MLTVALPVAIGVPYFGLQRLDLGEASRFELTAIDRWVPFQPAWSLVYASKYLLMPTTPLLATARRELVRYTAGLLAVACAGFAVFAVFPVACPRPAAAPAGGLYALVAALDSELNAFPSLHCAFAAYTVLFGRRVLRPALPGRAFALAMAVLSAWALAIFYSTLATRQHYFVDIPAGVALAIAGDHLAWSLGRAENRKE